MKKILKISEGIKLSQKFRKQNKTIVVVGGFFDILHKGHIKFLEASKKQGDYLFLLLEEDKKAIQKGPTRPINSQESRARILSAIQSVDYIILLNNMTNNSDYDKIITQIAPSTITTTYRDPNIKHKLRQAKLVNGKVVKVVRRIPDYSTTRLAKLINNQ